MKINKENYEAFFLDFYEGNLSQQEIDELHVFLNQHPDLREYFEGFENLALIPDTSIQFEQKDSLKKNELSSFPISQQNIDEVLLLETEGLLSEESIQTLEKFISEHPQYAKDQRILSHTHLNADLTVSFPAKESLKHTAIPVGSINESNYEEIMAQDLEGLLSKIMQDELREFLDVNTHLQKDKKIFALTKLEPDTSIIFTNKSNLKHFVLPVRKIVYYSLSAAATITLLIGVYNFWSSSPDLNQVAGLSSSVINPSNTQRTVSPTEKGNTQQVSPPLMAQSGNILPQPVSSSKGYTRSVQSSKTTIPDRSEQSEIPSMSALACSGISSHDHVDPEFMFIRTSQMHSNEFIELYYNIKLAEEIQYAQLNEKDKAPEKTIFNSLTSRVGELFAFNRKPREAESSNVSVWTFAELGVKTYNSLTQDNVKLDLERDEQGKVVGYNLVGDKLDLQREVKK